MWTINYVPAAAIQQVMPDVKISGTGAELAGKGWLVAIGPPTKVELEDIPDEVAAALPGITWLISVNIEPITAPNTAKEKAEVALKTLAKEFRGVLEDPQTGTIMLPSGSKRYRPTGQDIGSRVSTLNLNY